METIKDQGLVTEHKTEYRYSYEIVKQKRPNKMFRYAGEVTYQLYDEKIDPLLEKINKGVNWIGETVDNLKQKRRVQKILEQKDEYDKKHPIFVELLDFQAKNITSIETRIKEIIQKHHIKEQQTKSRFPNNS